MRHLYFLIMLKAVCRLHRFLKRRYPDCDPCA